MLPYNYSRLRGRMVEVGHTQETLSKEMRISVTSLNLKLNNKVQFKQDEMERALAALREPMDMVGLYFFTH